MHAREAVGRVAGESQGRSSLATSLLLPVKKNRDADGDRRSRRLRIFHDNSRIIEMRYLHTMVRVSDLDASLDFYCNKLGLVEVRRHRK